MYQGKKIIHIAARGLDGEIGANNKLLWNIPEDLQFFKESTIGHVVLMGRNTVESLPTTLKNRITISVSSKNYPLYDLSGEEVWDRGIFDDTLFWWTGEQLELRMSLLKHIKCEVLKLSNEEFEEMFKCVN